MTDTGIMWAGLHRAASESLVHATRDPAPACAIIFADEAIQAATDSLAHAKNERQRAVTDALITSAQRIKELAVLEADPATHGQAGFV